MNRVIGGLAGITCLTIWSACGSIVSRSQGKFFGAYPFQAVAVDGVMISKTFGPGQDAWGLRLSGPELCFWGLLSLPFDIAFDAVLLAPDLVAWAFGAHKYPDSAERVPPRPR